MPKQGVFIVSAVRSPIGALNGCFEFTPAKVLGSRVIREALKRAKLYPAEVDEVIMGQVLTAGQGQNVARQSAILADLPFTVPATTVNMLCGSGLKAVQLAYSQILSGQAKVVICGGQESMSRAEHTVYLRNKKLGNLDLKDSLLCDGLTDAFEQIHMGDTAEHLARTYKVSRKRQDEYAVKSQNRAEVAIKSGHFTMEIVPILSDKTHREVIEDEFPRFGTDLGKLLTLHPCFVKSDAPYPGTVTAGNASGINDGAAALVLCSGAYVEERDLFPMAKIIGFAQVGVEPIKMGLAPMEAILKLLSAVGWTKEEVDLYEINEAFAVQASLVQEHLGLPEEKVNVSGGSIALGHPLGASGARILVTLMYNLLRRNLRKGVAALCIGGGMGIAIAIEMTASMGDGVFNV